MRQRTFWIGNLLARRVVKCFPCLSAAGLSAAGLFVAGLAAASLPGAAAQGQAMPQSRITAEVVDAQRVSLPGSLQTRRTALADLGAVDDGTAMGSVMLALQPSPQQQSDLETLLAAQSDPQSPLFHHWLTPAEFGQRFGISDSDLAKLTSWLQSQGFTVEPIPAGRQTILFSGTAGQLRSAFGTSLHQFQTANGVQVANNSDPTVPAALAPVLAGFVSLSDRRHQATHQDLGTFTLDRSSGTVSPVGAVVPSAEAKAEGSAQPEFTTTVGTVNYHIVTPYDFATIYDLKPLWNSGIDGTGQTIAIVSRSNLNLSDVDKFRANFGLPASKVNKILVGADPGITADVAETALDVEWSGAVARNATVDLVVGGSTLTSDGTDLSALYIVNNNLAPVLSMSYGECEFSLGAGGNLFYRTLWQQAAAQGQTVFVSTGDASAATCDQGANYSTLGLTVNGLGSTPYNVAVGGTDLYGTYAATSTDWSATNDPATLSSALRYVAEIPWNDSCGNSVLLGVLQSKSGYTDTTTAQLCADRKVNTTNFRNVVGGGGGVSSCLSTVDGTPATCTGGYPKPSWQTGPGVPSDGVRDLPDVSLFAGDGLWGSFYPYCVGSETRSGICDLSNTLNIQGGGGTSFASPAFAGIMALINQKTQSSQGNPNKIFYKLASGQSGTDCTVENASAPSSCIFHDVDLGGNAVPCYAYGGAANCTVATTGAIWGVLSGYPAGRNYDVASGLGSVDITNLVNGWPAAVASLLPTTTTLTLSSTSVSYGTGPAASVTVTAASGTPTGDFTVLASGQTGRAASDPQGTLNGGKGTLNLALLPVGTYPVSAHYGGDTNDAASDSAPQTITVARASTTLSVTTSKATLLSAQSTLLSVTVAASGQGEAPSGSVVVTNSTTGATLGSFTLQQGASSPVSAVNINVPSTFLYSGANSLTLSYSGDANYLASSARQALTFNGPLALTLGTNTLTLAAGTASSSTGTTVTLAAANGSTLAYPVTLACVGTLPRGASCTLGSTVLTAGSTSTTVTVSYNPLLAEVRLPAGPAGGSGPAGTLISFAALGAGLWVFGRRKRLGGVTLAAVAALAVLSTLTGCSGTSPASGISLSASTATTGPGSPVTFNAVFHGTGALTVPTGTVTFNDNYQGGNRTLGTATVSPTGVQSGAASVTAGSLPIGLHTVSALYSGDSQFPGTTSGTVAVQVSSTSSLQIVATDANGQQAAAGLGVTLQ